MHAESFSEIHGSHEGHGSGNAASSSCRVIKRKVNRSSQLSSPATNVTNDTGDMENLNRKTQWILLAVASGACAAFNGAFAKLTTTDLTTEWAQRVAYNLGLGKGHPGVDIGIRAVFFALNLLFNAIMWALFTRALTRGTSTTQVSILNTSSNFILTALLGCLIFSERLPPLWFVGAALLVAGNVIIGRRDESETPTRNRADPDHEGLLAARSRDLNEEPNEETEEDVLQLGLGHVSENSDTDQMEHPKRI